MRLPVEISTFMAYTELSRNNNKVLHANIHIWNELMFMHVAFIIHTPVLPRVFSFSTNSSSQDRYHFELLDLSKFEYHVQTHSCFLSFFIIFSFWSFLSLIVVVAVVAVGRNTSRWRFKNYQEPVSISSVLKKRNSYLN